MLVLIEKGMGLRKGERHVVLARVRIVSVRVEALNRRNVTRAECIAEGLGHLSPAEFIEFWKRGHRHAVPATGPTYVRRIEWVYLD